MSRQIDLSKVLDEDEAQYLRHRPWLIRDAELSGVEIKWPDSEFSEEDAETGAESDEQESEEEEVDYSDLTVPELKAEIDARNDGREDDDKIAPASSKKDDLVAALEADDEDDEDESE